MFLHVLCCLSRNHLGSGEDGPMACGMLMAGGTVLYSNPKMEFVTNKNVLMTGLLTRGTQAVGVFGRAP